MKEYSLYLFDCDGTLIDTSELIFQSYRNTCGELQGDIPSREAVYSSIGIPLRKQMELFLGPLSDAQYDHAQKIHMEYQLRAAAKYLVLFDGIAETLEELRKRGKHLAVVTSRRRASLVEYLRLMKIDSFFEVLISPEDTDEHKPAPEPVEAALQALPAGDPLFIGDSRYDIECGSRAGVDTAFVEWSVAGLQGDHAPTWRITCPGDLLS
ncbi:MAG: HAD family hydrolase [Fibrobacterota bacterium]